MEFQNRRAASLIHSGKEWESNTSSRSEIPVRTVSQKFSHLQWRRLFKELWCRPTTTADFGSSFRQTPCTSNVCLLEDKIQDRGLYLFTISYGSSALDQRSGDGWFSGWFKIFIINTRYFNAEFWSTRCEIASALNRMIHNSHFKRRISLEDKRPRSRTVSFAEDRLLTWSVNTSGSQGPRILSRIMPTYSLLVFEVMIFRNSIRNGTEFYYQWRKSHLMMSWKDCPN